MSHAISVKAISKTYKKSLTRQVPALSNLSFDVPEKTIFGFVGPNGAGKSTLIKITMGLLSADTGQVCIFERSSCNPTSRARVGYVPEQPILYHQLTGLEYVKFSCSLYGCPGFYCRERGEYFLEKVGLGDAGKRAIRTYSKGMQQRLAIAQALVSEPDLIVLDEPLSGLDPVGRIEIQDLLLELNSQGKTIFFSSHILHDVETICHQVAFIVNGEMKYLGVPEDIEGIFKEALGL